MTFIPVGVALKAVFMRVFDDYLRGEALAAVQLESL
jgi:hypothetical protein